MIEIKNPYRIEALVQALEDTHLGIKEYFASLAADDFFRSQSGKWSPAQNLVHLIKSLKAVSVGLKMPKIVLRLKFGRTARVSRLYPQIRQTYLGRLAEGAESPQQFRPDDRNPPSDPEDSREQILNKWDAVNDALVEAFKRWKERDVDRYVLPHPILGSLTIREMIMFTIYHNVHHLTNVQKSRAEES